MDWLERCDWAKRSPEFGVLGEDVTRVQMEYLPVLPKRAWDLWHALPDQTNILRVDRVGFLRYAAFDWTHQRLAIDSPTALARLGSWGLVLARAYRHVAKWAGDDSAWLAQPLVKFDLEGVMRIGFLPAAGEHLPPETLDQWPLCDERALVYVVARTLVSLAVDVPWGEHMGKVLTRALDRDPSKRYAALGLFESQLAAAGARHIPRDAPSRNRSWPHIETGLGWLAIDRREIANACFRDALRFDPQSMTARLFVEHTASKESQETVTLSPWRDLRERGLACEKLHDWTGALALYKHVQCEDDNAVIEHALARARCRLALGDGDRAVAFAREVLARDPARHEARAIEVRALLEAKLYDDAIVAADAWISSNDDGEAHYARGRALLALKRLVEARDAFDRACVLTPKLVPALWLRSAVDRSLGRLRAVVGTPVPMPVDLAPGPVRDALVAGRVPEAIALLEREPPQQLLGDLLLYAGRYDDALRVFETLDGNAALAGKARALIDLGRTDEALAILDVIGDDGFVAIRR